MIQIDSKEAGVRGPAQVAAPTAAAGQVGSHSSGRLPIPRWLRTTCALTAIVLTGTLLTARVLRPSPNGLGTHQQLGLPPCTSIVLWDLPCPACGMTTSWAHMVRGQVLEAFYANAGGALLSIIALVCIPATCYFSLAGLATKRERFSLFLAASLLIAIVVAIAQWYFRSL
ncbi:MAG: DUF2752 domain-containing protein [Aureliella sp.]